MSTKMIVTIGIVSLFSFLAPDVCNAWQAGQTKTFIWEFGGKPEDTAYGSYDWNLRTYAKDQHINDKNENRCGNTWNVFDGLSDSQKSLSGVAPHPYANNEIVFSASSPKESSDPNKYVIAGAMIGSGQAVADDQGEHKGYASSWFQGDMKIPGGIINNIVKIKDGKVDIRDWGGRSKASIKGCKWNMVDPIALDLLEIETGLRYHETLFSLEAEGLGIGTFMWDITNGVVIDVPYDGSSGISLSIGSNSSWVTNGPGFGTASLMGGDFITTGNLVSLPWHQFLDFAGNVIRVELLPSDIPYWSVSYEIPDDILIPNYMYEPSLQIGFGLGGSEGVPEPSTFILFAISVSGLMICGHNKKRRFTKRGQ